MRSLDASNLVGLAVLNQGFIGVAAASGFIIGPALGGYLAEFSDKLPPLIAAFIYALDFLFVLLCVPESNRAVLAAEQHRSENNTDDNRTSTDNNGGINKEDNEERHSQTSSNGKQDGGDKPKQENVQPSFVAAFKTALATELVGELLVIYFLFNMGFLIMKSNFSVFNGNFSVSFAILLHT